MKRIFLALCMTALFAVTSYRFITGNGSSVTVTTDTLVQEKPDTVIVENLDTAVLGAVIQKMTVDTLDMCMLDSVLVADKLPDFTKWASSEFTDDETHQTSVYRTLYDNSTGIIYTLKSLSDSIFVFIKKGTAN